MTEPPSKRVFVALGTTPELQEAVAAWAAAHGTLPVRWLSGKNLHVTLVPPWYENDHGAVARQLQPLGRTKTFTVQFDRVSYGPSLREPRLIWAEGAALRELVELKRQIESLLGACLPAGRRSETRPFRLHLTLARFRPEQFASFPVKHLDERVLWTEEVRSVLLMESHLSPSGADYKVLAEIPLR